MNSYLTAEPQRSQRDDLLFCFSLRRRKAKSSHLRSMRFLKALYPMLHCLACALAAALSAAECFFIAALSAAMKKDMLLSVLCGSSEAGDEFAPTHLLA